MAEGVEEKIRCDHMAEEKYRHIIARINGSCQLGQTFTISDDHSKVTLTRHDNRWKIKFDTPYAYGEAASVKLSNKGTYEKETDEFALTLVTYINDTDVVLIKFVNPVMTDIN